MRGRRGSKIGLAVVAVLTLVALLPTAIEYAVMLAGITFNAID